MDRGGMAAHRERLLSGLAGRVLEVGAGSGMNFQKYPPEVTNLVALEPQPDLCEYMRQRAEEAPIDIDIVGGIAERIPFESAAFDAAVVSLTLCSVIDPREVLGELFRVVRPGGRLHFLEHVRAGSGVLRRIQQVLDATIWPWATGDCHVYRDSAATIREAGFEMEWLEELRFPDYRVALPTSPHILGAASRPAS
jgi:ubiquinone/menaquinone biosynthesis C-methylase UbiE